ncbi:MAG TPA: hypothetical protein VKA34_03705 [Balneolales bacterium]|nr:hypothetical protein [Balneolales bacterium]
MDYRIRNDSIQKSQNPINPNSDRKKQTMIPKEEIKDELTYRNYFLSIIPIHNHVKNDKHGITKKGHVRGQVEGHVPKKQLNEMEMNILGVLKQGPCSTNKLLKEIGQAKRTGYFRRTINGLMEDGLISYTYPETPKHPDQKYQITVFGKESLKENF